MSFSLLIAVVILAGFIGLVGTILVERFAPAMGLVKAPNERSSHIRPTPRGGGVAIAAAVVLAGVMLSLAGNGSLWAMTGAVLAIAVLGFCDDLMDLSPALRFPIQGLVFVLLVWTSSPLLPIDTGLGFRLEGWPFAILAVIVGLWWVNLFNFMDGIDGIAATHGILVLAGAALIWIMGAETAGQDGLFWFMLAVIAATAGFLLRNWPPARIFMGDAGSNALAVAIFAIALGTSAAGEIGYPAWLILPAAFVGDATVTVIRRSARGERPWQAHRRHAYQQLSRLWGHRRVTLLYSALTAFWSVPLALLSTWQPALGWWLVLVAYAPILIFVIWARAGATDETGTPAGH